MWFLNERKDKVSIAECAQRSRISAFDHQTSAQRSRSVRLTSRIFVDVDDFAQKASESSLTSKISIAEYAQCLFFSAVDHQKYAQRSRFVRLTSRILVDVDDFDQEASESLLTSMISTAECA